MANEFIARNGLIAQNSSTVTGSLTVTSGITGSLFGTSSWAQSSSVTISSSFATTASYALTSSFSVTASYVNYITGSGTTNRHSKFTAGNTIGDSLIFDDGTNVQITGSTVTISGSSASLIVTGSIRSSGGFTGSISASSLQGSILNSQLQNSSVTIGSTNITLGGTSTTLAGLSSVSSTSLTGSLTASSLIGTITNAQLTNSSITVGSTTISLGATSTTLAGLSSVSSTSFTGSFTGSLTGALIGTSSWATNATSASFVNTLNQSVLITGSLTVGTSSIGANENTLVLGPSPAGGIGEGGQLLLQAPNSGGYTSASMWDNYQNQTRLLRGTNAGSDALVAFFSMHTKQMSLPAYNSLGAFSGTPVAALGVNSSGDIITIQTGSQAGGSGVTINNNTDNYLLTATGTANTINGEANLQFNGSTLSVTGNVTATSITSSNAVISLANNSMYFRGGDDAELWDINVVNTVGVYGQQDQGIGAIKLGSGGGTLTGRSGSIGIGTIIPSNATVLDVVGTCNVSGTLLVTGSARFTGSLSVSSNVIATSFTGSISASNLQGSILNSQLQNSSVTVGTTAISLGASSTTLAGLTSVSSTSLTGSLTASSLVGAITNTQLQNSSTTIGTTAISLGGSSTTLTGLTSLNVTGSVRFSGSAATELTILGTQEITGSLIVSNNVVAASFTGSLLGTSSWASNVVTAQTASYTNYVTGSGTTNRHAKFTAAATIGDSLIFDDGTNVQVTGSIVRMSSAARTTFIVSASTSATNVGINSPNFDVTNPEALFVSGSTINIVSGEANINNYAQLNIINLSNGANSSADIVATNNTGTETGNFVNLGINGSNYGGAVGANNEAYLYNTGSNFVIGNTTRGANANLKFFAGNDGTLFPIVVTGSVAIITGSLLGTASWATNVVGGAGSTFPYTGSAIISGSLIVTGSVSATQGGFTGSLFGTAATASKVAVVGYGPGITSYLIATSDSNFGAIGKQFGNYQNELIYDSTTKTLNVTSSWATNLVGGSGAAFPYTGTATITGSVLQQTGSAFFPTLNASESLSAGDFINITASFVRRASSNDTTKQAHGFVLAAVASGSAATIYYNGIYVTASAGLTVGSRYFLSTAGQKATTAPTTTGQLSQEIGVAVSTNAMLVNFGPAIIT